MLISRAHRRKTPAVVNALVLKM